jgi:hypothetical protein
VSSNRPHRQAGMGSIGTGELGVAILEELYVNRRETVHVLLQNEPML